MNWLVLLCGVAMLLYLYFGGRRSTHRPRAGGGRVRNTPRAPVEQRAPRHSQRYTDYMRSPEWAQRRAQILRRAGYRCEFCRAPGPLQVHHLTYRHLGHEFEWELIALCKPCHEAADRLRRSRRWS